MKATRPNEIYDDTIIKYTLNIPKEWMAKISHKTRKGTKYNGHKSTYLREIIERDLVQEKPISKRKLRYLEKKDQAEVYEPPRRFEGFLGGLLRNSFCFSWFRKKMLDRESTQLYN